MADTFSPLPGRDAYAAIRGFVYQVQRTILAWLALPPDAALLCEAGEDIDHLRGALSDDGERLLEQVKFREDRLSLHSSEVLEALGNFLAARERNPGHELRFRFFTNAGAATERGNGFPGDLTGIDAWNAIRAGTVPADERAAILAALRAALGNAATGGAGRRYPPQAATVSRFLDDVDDATLARGLVDRVEFALGNAGVDDLRTTVERELRSRGIVQNATEAGQLYLALFTHIFHLLGRTGEKRLDPPTLARIAEAGTLAAVDRATLDCIEGHLADASAQMASVQDRLAIIQHHTSPEQIEATMASAFQNSRLFSLPGASPDGPERYPVVAVPPLTAPLVGREAQLAALRERLIVGGGVARVALQGLPGAGKSSLAVALCRDQAILAHFTGGVLWASLGPRANAASALYTWGAALGVDLAEVRGLSERAQRLSHHLQDTVQDRPLLLVLDDIWRREDLAPFLAVTTPRMAVVLTSRDRQLAREFQRSAPVVVAELAHEDALALLVRYCPEAEAADPGGLRELAQAAGGLPLALVLIGAELAAHADQRRWVGAAVARLKAAQARRALAEPAVRPGMDGMPLTLQAVVELSVEALPDDSVRAAFTDLAVFAPKPVDFAREAAFAVWDVTELEGDGRLRTLTRQGLLEIAGEDRFALHQVLSAVAASRRNGETGGAARHFAFFLGVARSDHGRWAAIEREWPQIRQAWAWAGDAPGRELPILLLAEAAGDYLVRRGLVAEAIDWHNRALAATRTLGRRGDEAACLDNLGTMFHQLGEYDLAREHYKQALVLVRAIGDRAGEASVLNNLGRLQGDGGDQETALRCYSASLEIKQSLGDQPGDAAVLNNIGRAYYSLGQLDQALEYHRQALARQRALGNRVGEIAPLNGVGMVYHAQGRLDEALQHHLRALAIAEEFGDRANLASSLGLLGEACRDRGEFDRAFSYFERALALALDLGDRGAEGRTRTGLGQIHQARGEFDQAHACFERGIQLERETGDRWGEALALQALAKLRQEEGKLAEALDLLRRARQLSQETQDWRGEVSILLTMAAVHAGMGDTARAIAAIEGALALETAHDSPGVEQHRTIVAELRKQMKGTEK